MRTRRTILPWGTITSFTGTTGGSAPVLRPMVRIRNGDAFVSWGGPRALIGGVVPTIEKQRIFEADRKTKRRPEIQVKRSDFKGGNEVGIYFRVKVYTSDFSAQVVEPIVSVGLPKAEPYTAYKLALFLRMRRNRITYSEADDRQLFCGQGFLAIRRRNTGHFEPLFWAQF